VCAAHLLLAKGRCTSSGMPMHCDVMVKSSKPSAGFGPVVSLMALFNSKMRLRTNRHDELEIGFGVTQC
jgi:hypothetical protein